MPIKKSELYSSLWASCDKLRGGMDASQYKDYILELGKKPPRCLEYIVVHEMVHLLERHHNDRFRALMNQFLPHWQTLRDELNHEPLGHAEWEY